MRAREFREMTAEELEHEAIEATQASFNLRVQAAGGQQVDNVKRFKELRRNIARIKTVLNEKKRQEDQG